MFKKHNKPIYLTTLLISLTVSISAYCSGYVSWYSDSDKCIHRVSVLNGNHVVFYENHIDTLPNYKVEYATEGLPMSFRGHLFTIGEDLLATFSGSNMVFKLDTLSKRVYRIDETIYSGYNFQSYQFSRRDTIYSFGGYGFWIENNLLSYYSTQRKEWSVYTTAPFNPYTPDFAESGFDHKITFYDQLRDELYVIRRSQMYRYSFRKDLWEMLGALDLEDLIPERFRNSTPMTHRLSDTTFLLFGSQRTFLFDPGNNEIRDITLPNKINTITSADQLGLACGYDLPNELVLVKHSDNIESGYFFEYVNRLFNRGTPVRPIYEKKFISNQVKLSLAFLVFMILGGFLTVRIRNAYLSRRSQFYSDEQWRFIQAIDKKSLTTDDLNGLLSLTNSSWEVQRRKRSEFVKAMNELSMNQLGCELVERRKSSLDKRQVIYVMNTEAKSKLARLM